LELTGDALATLWAVGFSVLRAEASSWDGLFN
jgi:hypothetical protein